MFPKIMVYPYFWKNPYHSTYNDRLGAHLDRHYVLLRDENRWGEEMELQRNFLGEKNTEGKVESL